MQHGYLPQPTYSEHWIRDSGFKRVVADSLRRETRAMREEMEML
jgi:predicted N-acyltransferase